MLSGIPAPTGRSVQQTILYANSVVADESWQTYTIPPNVSMLSILLLGAGGGGGTGATTAEDAGGGGGGGGSGSQASLLIPAALLPPVLYFSIGYGGASTAAGIRSRLSVAPVTTASNCLLLVNGGAQGTSTTGAGGGAGGTGGTANALTTFPLGGLGYRTILAGQTGSAGGGADSNGTNLALPTTGLVVTGGTGGGGQARDGEVGPSGGNRTTPAGNLFFPPQIGGPGGTAATSPPSNGSAGINFIKELGYFYGGTGGGATNGSPTGAGAVKSFGGNGGYGCGGGGGGAGITGSTGGGGGRGGDGIAFIYAW